MSSEHFIKYLRNPKLLDEVTYDELSQLRETYPYSHILHYLLFLKSQQSPAYFAEHQKNASIFAVDNTKIFEEIKEFQELEQKPTEKHTMDDLFDLSDDEENKENEAINNEATPTNDSESLNTDTKNETILPSSDTPDTTRRVIREQRYIPLDPSIYGTFENPVEQTKPVVPVTKIVSKKEDAEDDNKKSNVFFIDALINLDNGDDRIELISNKDAYKDVIGDEDYVSEEKNEVQESETLPISNGAPVVFTAEKFDEPSPEITNEEVEEFITPTIDTPIDIPPFRSAENSEEISNTFIEDIIPTPFETTADIPPIRIEEIPVEISHEIIESITPPIIEIPYENAPIEIEEIPQNISDEQAVEILKEFEDDPITTSEEIYDQGNFDVEAEEKSETKKSFDNWVRKKEGDTGKKKSKKKKKKKAKIPVAAKESLMETDIIASETLAELLVKQGRNKKAIKVYERLCLIFPQKSNYFAQIIKNLKEQS